MLSRTLRARSALRLATPSFRATYSSQKKAEVPANDPVARKEVQTVSETNATATSSEGSFDKVLQESVEQAEKLRKQQAPNRQGIWSRSQQPREIAMSGPRFEQTIIEDQVRLEMPIGPWEVQLR
jgi:NADH dehydrogenase (ubiquinone) Fe-S protein 6